MKDFIKTFRPVIPIFLDIWYFITRPTTTSAKMIVVCEGEIILVTQTYRFGYDLPGGGVKKGEHPQVAARRELWEEVGIHIQSATPFLTIPVEGYKKDTWHVYYAEVPFKSFRVDLWEIDHARWFPLDKLPKLDPYTLEAIESYKKLKSSSSQ